MKDEDRTYRATVTRVDGSNAYVLVPKLGLGIEYGPCEYISGATLSSGQRVIVSTVNGVPEDLVILGALA